MRTLELPPKAEKQLTQLASRLGKSTNDYVATTLIEHLKKINA